MNDDIKNHYVDIFKYSSEVSCYYVYNGCAVYIFDFSDDEVSSFVVCYRFLDTHIPNFCRISFPDIESAKIVFNRFLDTFPKVGDLYE